MTWCLDWREVCDGKPDCWPNHVDEHLCEKLEQNECASNEYRCFNGQCIPETFLFDKTFVPDCVDGTDENKDDAVQYAIACKTDGDQSFRCADGMCSNWNSFSDSCGRKKCDGINCRDILTNKFDRDLLLPTANTHIKEECWATMICLIQALEQVSLVSRKISIAKLMKQTQPFAVSSCRNSVYIIHLNKN
jgi:hypothetical protein